MRLTLLLIFFAVPSGVPANEAEPPDPTYLEWRQRLTQTARKSFLERFRPPVEGRWIGKKTASGSAEVRKETSPMRRPPPVPKEATSPWELSSRFLNPYRIPGFPPDREKLGEWDWRERLRVFLQAGFPIASATPQSATLPTPSTTRRAVRNSSSEKEPPDPPAGRSIEGP